MYIIVILFLTTVQNYFITFPKTHQTKRRTSINGYFGSNCGELQKLLFSPNSCLSLLSSLRRFSAFPDSSCYCWISKTWNYPLKAVHFCLENNVVYSMALFVCNRKHYLKSCFEVCCKCYIKWLLAFPDTINLLFSFYS